jgi:hypothetical protein
MTVSAEIETKTVHLAFLSMQLVITLIKICKIGISLHTSAEVCAWNTNVHFT